MNFILLKWCWFCSKKEETTHRNIALVDTTGGCNDLQVREIYCCQECYETKEFAYVDRKTENIKFHFVNPLDNPEKSD